MDKFEYKVRAEEIKNLIARGEYVQAAEIADTIDWRRVKSVMMLCMIGDLYKLNRRYEDAKNMLLLAYERRPGGRTICYSLCELCIKTEEFVRAVDYYKEYVQAAPKDSGRFILQYKLYEAQDVSLEERIGVLEELKKRDYREKWAYELAYLYHRVGLATRCVEECDELILWFGDGKYVIKAMELKMLHQPLTPEQQERYDHRFDSYEAQVQEESYTEEQVAAGDQDYSDGQGYESGAQDTAFDGKAGILQGDTLVYEEIRRSEEGRAARRQLEEAGKAEKQPGDLDIQVKIMDVGQYNTIDMQAEQAALVQEVLGGNWNKSDEITRSIIAPMMDTGTLDNPQIENEDINEDNVDIDNGAETIESTEVFFGETGEIADFQPVKTDKETLREVEADGTAPQRQNVLKEALLPNESGDVQENKAEIQRDEIAEAVMNQLRIENNVNAEEQVRTAQPPRELAGVLSQESDGQIRLVVPEGRVIEKQITGQLSIQDILNEWEQMKKEGEERRKEEVRQHVLQHTGEIFTEFEASVKDGLLEQLENGMVEGEPVQAQEDLEDVDLNPGEVVLKDILDIPESLDSNEDNESENVKIFEEGSESQNDAETFEEAYPPHEDAEAFEEGFEDQDNAKDSGGDFSGEESHGDETGFWTEGEGSDDGATLQGDVLEEQGEAESLKNLGGTEELGEDPENLAGTEELGESPKDLGGAEEPGENPDKSVNVNKIIPGQHAASQKTKTEASREKETGDADLSEHDTAGIRPLTREEKELFGPYIQSRLAREQLVNTIDNISLASYTGNVIITGDEGMDTSTLAKNLIREVQMTDSNFSGKVAKISGQALNNKDVASTLQQLKNGALIIQKASEMNSETARILHRQLQSEALGIIIVMEDTKKAINKLLEENEELGGSFTARMEVQALSNDTLVAFGRKYAKEMEYSIDALGMLALHTRIEERQTSNHAVTVIEVKEIVDEAIRHANRKTMGHFVDILLAKRYDEEDMIILTEKDFV